MKLTYCRGWWWIEYTSSEVFRFRNMKNAFRFLSDTVRINN